MERSWLVGASLLVVGCAGAREPPRADDDAGSADAAATVPSYPSGPTGIDRQGQIFPRLTFQGYVGGEGGPWATLDLGQLHDPTGTRGIHALVIVACAAWCPECGDVATKYPKFFSERYRPRGARFVYLLLEDKLAGSPATFTTATDWNARFHLPFDLGIDPARTTLPAVGGGVPRIYLVDPRTMTIVRISSSIDPTFVGVPGLDTLLDFNGAPAADAGADGG